MVVVGRGGGAASAMAMHLLSAEHVGVLNAWEKKKEKKKEKNTLVQGKLMGIRQECLFKTDNRKGGW